MGATTTVFFLALVLIVPLVIFQNVEILDINSLTHTITGNDLNQLMSKAKAMLSDGLGYFTANGDEAQTDRIFTKQELLTFKYKYLAIAGEVFDVSKGDRHYGKDGHYNFFTGVDGTKAFISGDFTDAGLHDDVEGLDAASMHSIEEWRLMYHKDYTYVGKVVGYFYDSNGRETENNRKYKVSLKEAEKSKLAEQELKNLYPPCNAEFKNSGSRVWCSNQSGGIRRSWIGVPRKMFSAGGSSFRCACIRTTGPPSTDLNSKSHNNRGDIDSPNLREYDNCSPTSESCAI